MYRFYFNCHHWKPTSDQWIYANRCLSSHELQRIDQFVYQDDVKFRIIGQLLIRYLLKTVFHKNSSTFVIERTKLNRPFIKTDPLFDFNLSHQNQLVCIAGTFDGQIGCDTMVYRAIKWENFRKKFTLNEQNLIEKNPLNFSRLWCLKESYIKYLGLGTTYPLAKLNFHLKTDDFNKNPLLSDTKLEMNLNLRFDEQMISLLKNQYQLITLCLNATNPYKSFIELNINDILNVCTPFDQTKSEYFISWERFQKKKTKEIISRDLYQISE